VGCAAAVVQHGWKAVHIATYWGFDKMAQLLNGWQGNGMTGSLNSQGSKVVGRGAAQACS
jgi:hypothetical protein